MTSARRHPKALPFLFLTEMWERFGFYVVQGMLVLYMTKAFGYSDNQSFTILGVFSALAYIAPMAGGLLADKVLGFKVAILWGGIFLILGYALLALPWANGFYLALATIIVGNGLFKPNISSLLGALYKPGDPARDAGFTLFYIGINLGVLLAGASSGYIKDYFGWHAGFGLASLGLIIGLCTFGIGVKWGGINQSASPFRQSKNNFLRKPWLIMYCLLTIAGLSFLLQSSILGKWLLPTVGVLLIFFVFALAYRQTSPYRQRLITLNILIISSIIFWMIFLQIFFSVNLFIDRLVNKQIAGFHLSTTIFYSLESIFVILLGPLFAWSWQTLNQNKRNPAPFLKFIFAIVFVGLGFLVLAICTYFPNTENLINPLWIVFSYFFITVGEMLLSPIGLSAVTLLAPPQLTGMMMGIWFVALGFGGEFAGWLAKLSSISDSAQNAVAQLPVYRNAFLDYAYLAFGVAIALFVLRAFLRKKLES